MFTGNALWIIIAQSDLVTWFVLLVLLVLSVVSWSLFFYKSFLVRVKMRQVEHALEKVGLVHSMEDLLTLSGACSGTLAGLLLGNYLSLSKDMLTAREGGVRMIAEQDWLYMQSCIDQAITDLMHDQERGVSFIATTAAVSPLLGLLGTVWGLIHSFIRISQQQSADIATVAPGLAEALITTLAGVMVAIPALMLYHFLVTRNRELEHYLVMLSDRLNGVMYRLFVRRGVGA